MNDNNTITNNLPPEEYTKRDKIIYIPYEENHCKKCNTVIPKSILINKKRIDLRHRTYCMECSPIGERKMCGPNPKYYNKGEGKTENGKRILLSYDRICQVCGKIYNQKTRNNTCGTCKSKKLRRENKIELVKVHGGKCIICGYSKCIKSLCFHHLDPSKKELSISNVPGFSYDTLLEESKKCILVCHNCHNEIHDNMIDVSKYKNNLNS